MTVTDPWGTTWAVWRRWYPWRRRIGFLDGLEKVLEVALDPLVLLLSPRLLGKVAVGGTLFVVETVALPLLLPFTVLWRALRLGDWPVEAERAGHPVGTRWVAGFGAAGAVRDRTVELIRAGAPHPVA